MKTRSIKVNYFLNLFRVGFGTLVGLLTMPYVNKVLGAESLGKVEYINSIINYFMMFSALGIPMYGIREVAKVREDAKERSKLVLELLTILLVTTVISYLIIFGILIQLDYFKDSRQLIILMSSMILFGNIGVEWFYQGIENQVFITVRYTIVRIITLVLLYLFVKAPSDYLWYGFIVVLTTVGANVFNLAYLRKYIKFNLIKSSELDLKSHLKPIFTIFIATISVSIYIQLDNIMLGSFSGVTSVGYYAVANKLVRFVISFVTTLGAVMLPRLSHLIIHDKQQYFNYAQKSINFILLIAIPFTFIFIIMAEDFILLMAGQNFVPSILTMQILSPIIIIVGIAYFLGFLILYPQGKERIYTVATIFSAVLSVILNLFLIKHYQQYGTALVAVLSELLGIILMFALGKKELKDVKFLNKSSVFYLVGSVLMCLVIFFISNLISEFSILYKVFIKLFVGLSFFSIFLLLMKEASALDIFNLIRSKFSKI